MGLPSDGDASSEPLPGKPSQGYTILSFAEPQPQFTGIWM